MLAVKQLYSKPFPLFFFWATIIILLRFLGISTILDVPLKPELMSHSICKGVEWQIKNNREWKNKRATWCPIVFVLPDLLDCMLRQLSVYYPNPAGCQVHFPKIHLVIKYVFSKSIWSASLCFSNPSDLCLFPKFKVRTFVFLYNAKWGKLAPKKAEVFKISSVLSSLLPLLHTLKSSGILK